MDGAAAREDPEAILRRAREDIEELLRDPFARMLTYGEVYPDDPFPGREEWVRRPWDKKNWRKGSR